MKTTAVPEWMPADRPLAVPCGEWFDAVTVYGVEGVRAIARLRERSGPVVEDLRQGLMRWFVKPGAAARWSLPCVTVLGAGCEVEVPPADALDTAALHWAVPPGGDCTTDPGWLHEVLVTVTGGQRWAGDAFVSPECHFEDHEKCDKADVPPSPRGSSVRQEPCVCPCHEQPRRAAPWAR